MMKPRSRASSKTSRQVTLYELTARDFFAATVGSADIMVVKVPEDQKELVGCEVNSKLPIRQLVKNNSKLEAFLRYAYADAMLKQRLSPRKPTSSANKRKRK